jgi:two-component system phosphate regulon sensor histidine kinase PhoR
MNKTNSTFPWHYYVRTLRSRIILIILTVSLCFIAAKLSPNDLLKNSFIIFLTVTLITVVVSIFRIQPFMRLLGRIDKIQVKLPHNKKLSLIYQKNEWRIINEVLTLTEDYINQQEQILKRQSIESDVLIESIPNEIVIIDKFQNCKKYNRLFKDQFITGKEASVIKDEKLWKIFENQEILSAFSSAIQHDQCFRLPGIHIDQDYYDIAITPIKDTSDEVLEALGIFHNVTNLKLTEKMRVDFVANVSHEIRTPLTSIKGYSQLLAAQQQNLPEGSDVILDKIVSNTERLKDLFDNLLKLSVIESQYEVTKEEIDLDQFLTKIEAGLKGKYLNKEFKINKDIQSYSLFGDKKLLEQVITNLIDNSIKYTSKNPQIDIKAIQKENQTILEISDNGPGIKENELNRIFERFYRVQGESSKAIEGTGLGLSIVKHIINKHKGEIKVNSIVGQGTTFTITLPN